MLLRFASDTTSALPAPPTAATTTSSTATEASASRSHAGGATTTAGAGVRSVVSAGTSPEGDPVSAAAAREVPPPYAIRSASVGPVPKAGATTPVSEAGSSGAIAGQIAALSTKLLPRTALSVSEGITASRSPKPVRGRPVSMWGPAAMFRIMLPPIAGTSAASGKS